MKSCRELGEKHCMVRDVVWRDGEAISLQRCAHCPYVEHSFVDEDGTEMARARADESWTQHEKRCS